MWQKIKNLLFYNQTLRQTVAKNVFWLTVSNFGGRLLRAIIIIYSARILGAAEWGIFSYAVSLVAFVTSFTDIGLNSILMRETSRLAGDQKTQRQILSTSFILKLVLLAVSIAAVFFAVPRITTIAGIIPILPIAVFVLVFDTFRDFGLYLVRALEKMEWEAGLYLLTNIAIVVLGFIFLYFRKTVGAFTLSYALGDGLGAAATLFVLRKNLAGIFSSFSYRLLKFILVSAWPLAISALLGVLMINTDILIIGWLRTAEDVGLYSAAQRIVQLLYLLPAIMGVALLPSFARLANKDNRKLRKMTEQSLGFMFLIAIPAALGGAVFSQEIVNLLFGPGYAKAVPSFAVLLLTILIDFPAVILSGLIFAYNKQKNLTLYSAIGGVSNVVLDLLLIPRFGITGSAFATLSAQFLSNIYLQWAAKRTNYFRILPLLKKIFLAAALMTGLVLVLKIIGGINVVIAVGAAALFYFGALFLLKEPLLGEFKLILQQAAPAGDKSANS